MNRRRFLGLLGGAGCVGYGAPASLWAQTRVPGISPLEIRLGTSLGLTGPEGPQVYDYLRGFVTQLDETSSQGGVHERRLTLFALDHGAQPQRAVRNVVSLLNENEVFSLVALGSTDALLRVLPLLSRNRFHAAPITPDPLLFGAWGGAQALYEPSLAQRIFCFRPSFELEMDVLVGQLIAEGRERPSLCYSLDATGRAIQDAVTSAATRHGCPVVAEAAYAPGESVDKAWQHLRSEPTDTVICALHTRQVAEWVELCQNRSWPLPVALPSTVGGELLLADLAQKGLESLDQEILQSRVVPTLDEGDPEALALRELTRRRDANLSEHWRPAEHVFEHPLTAAGLEGFLTAKALIRALELAGPEPDAELFTAAWSRTRELEPEAMSPPEDPLEGTSSDPFTESSSGPTEAQRRPVFHPRSVILARAVAGGKWRRLSTSDTPDPDPSPAERSTST